MKAILFACCVVLFSTIPTNADVPPTKPKPAEPERINAEMLPPEGTKIILHTGLEVTTDPNLWEAKLQIPRSQFFKLHVAGLEGAPADLNFVDGFQLSSLRTIIAGLLMFLSISVAGVLIARSSSFGRTQKAIAAIVIVAVMLGAAAIITRGNAGPPGSYRWRNLPQALAKGEATLATVDVELVPDEQLSGRMRLIIPLKKQNAPGEE